MASRVYSAASALTHFKSLLLGPGVLGLASGGGTEGRTLRASCVKRAPFAHLGRSSLCSGDIGWLSGKYLFTCPLHYIPPDWFHVMGGAIVDYLTIMIDLVR